MNKKMIELPRVCIVLGLECNLFCKYCYRDYFKKDLPKKISNNLKQYLQQLTPDKCESVCVSGGEPLLYLNTIYEVFSYVPLNVHKKIMTNGTLLTQEIVDYANKNNIEIQIGYDGIGVKFLRGIDILEDRNILYLISQIKWLTISSVITNKTNNIIENYKYICNKIGRNDFYWCTFNLINTGKNNSLIENFDYELFSKTYREHCINNFQYSPHYNRVKQFLRDNEGYFNVDLDGNIIGMLSMKKYGTINNTYDECLLEKKRVENNICKETNCPISGNCIRINQRKNEHYCKCSFIESGLD